ncbi:hypothetical protein OG239_42480 (plasmid) [Streptomyces sp. NBC_00868]|uniref:hypothetical protein n=1 Tax=Streptomyces sp. NBC_00868 TaxID=2903683 RepID=UPI002F913D87|nr:hypothetical protein OG239_42480 [Streptomyces sp. NBC_00868]
MLNTTELKDPGPEGSKRRRRWSACLDPSTIWGAITAAVIGGLIVAVVLMLIF